LSWELLWGEHFTHHNSLGVRYILATVAHNLEICGLHWWLVAHNCV
jgi:hypothetical protein